MSNLDNIIELSIENNDLKSKIYTLEYFIKYYEKVLKNHNLENFILERKTKNE